MGIGKIENKTASEVYKPVAGRRIPPFNQSNEVPVLPEKSGELSVASIVGGRIPPLNKINNDINYKRKDLILLALVCYMKVDEVDINKKNIFISATDEELKAAGDGGIA